MGFKIYRIGTSGTGTSIEEPGSNNNTTPAAPIVTGNDELNILSASHALGDSQIVFRENGGPFQPYAGAIVVGDATRALGYWEFKIKSAAGRNESAIAKSPAFNTYEYAE